MESEMKEYCKDQIEDGGHLVAIPPEVDLKLLPWKGKISFFVKNITLEPLVFLCAVASTMQSVVIQALVKEQTCLVTYGYSEAYCLNVTNDSIKLELEGVMADYNVYTMVLETIPFMVLSLFAGAWSDQHGPKLLIFSTLTTNILGSATFALLSYVKYVPPEYTLIGHAICGISGNQTMFYIAVFNYIVVNSSVKSRTTRITFIETAFLTGAPIGYQLGGWLYGNRNFTLVFFCSLLVFFMGVPYTVYRLRSQPTIVGPKSKALRGMFQLQHLKAGYLVLAKKREGRKRLLIILTLLCTKAKLFPQTGGSTIFFPYVELVLKFTVKLFSYYGVCIAGIVWLGSLIGLPLMSYVFGVSDVIIAIITGFMLIAGELLIAFSYTPLMLFLSTTLFIFSPAMHIVSRSLMSQCVNEDEQGKLISVSGLLSSGIPLLASFVYDRIFRATMATFPNACFFLSAAIYTLPTIGFIWIYRNIRQHPTLHQTKTEDEIVLVQTKVS